MVVLKGKRASIGKADLAERNASRCARQVDSVASHRTMDMSDHYARDTVGIYKPPIITWCHGPSSLRSPSLLPQNTSLNQNKSTPPDHY